MAMPSPASDNMEIDFAIMAGISTFHLHTRNNNTTLNHKPIKMERQKKKKKTTKSGTTTYEMLHNKTWRKNLFIFLLE